MRLSIVIPAYNEEATLEALLERVHTLDLFPIEKEIIIVNDGSRDRTLEIASVYATNHQNITVLSHEHNRGKGAAVRTGFAHATGEYVVVQDADLEYDPNDFRAMLALAQEKNAGAVYGSRRLPLPGQPQKRGKWYYYLGGVTLTYLANIIYDTRITDEPTCYKMIRGDVLKEIPLVSNGFEFCPEITAKIAKRGIYIYEVPIHYNPRDKAHGKKIRAQDGIIAIWTLLRYIGL
jgi:dolichol-phosphate mannosyltransferase